MIFEVHDKVQLAAFLSQKPALNAYPLGDLDEAYWSKTQWWALESEGQIREVALLYSGMAPPILIAIPNSSSDEISSLLSHIQVHLPTDLYAHMGPGLLTALPDYELSGTQEPHHMMELQDRVAHEDFNSEAAFRLSDSDFKEVLILFDLAYPGHWFRQEMLSFGPYFGVRDADGELVAVGGVHVYSEKYQVASIGNVVTHPRMRGQGYATQVSARLIEALRTKVKTIELNVHAENSAALQLYRKLGFRKIANYFEMSLTKISS